MSTLKYLRVFALTLILLVTLVGQSQAQGQPAAPANAAAVLSTRSGRAKTDREEHPHRLQPMQAPKISPWALRG